jgi:hypothetical protein
MASRWKGSDGFSIVVERRLAALLAIRLYAHDAVSVDQVVVLSAQKSRHFESLLFAADCSLSALVAAAAAARASTSAIAARAAVAI